jgi:hypothetical protein
VHPTPLALAPRPPPARRRQVVAYDPDPSSLPNEHGACTRAGFARRLAALLGFDFAGAWRGSRDGDAYFVPADTLVGVSEAAALGIRSEADLFGGVVPHRFVGSKVITHPLVDAGARAPAGWSPLFAHEVRDVVLDGFAAFARADALRAGMRLLERGGARVKLARGIGGAGQSTAVDVAELRAALDAIDDEELARFGVVVEQNLEDVTTYSVGQVRVGTMVATYCGTQRTTLNNRGHEVYGGSDLFIAQGPFDALLACELSEPMRVAIAQARSYDRATRQFPGFFASRRNYDVAQGRDGQGRRRVGVLEQSWRAGGATGAEIAALEAFAANPGLPAVRASTVEVYGDSPEPPADATIYFRGVDPRVGMLTKYSRIVAHVDPR